MVGFDDGLPYTPTVPPLDDALLGEVLDGRYRIESRIADGGMATVYLATDDRLGREVAVKVMRAALRHDDTFVKRFRQEAYAAASLSHPNVVAVHDQGEDRGHMFLVMEYVPGLTLREVLQSEGALTPRAALDILDPVLQALEAAHLKGIAHRDVKPENVIIGDNGIVKVADFGLARAVTSQTITSTTGTLLGTVAYLAPEQVERGVADVRSDVYAAGLVLFEMLTGTKAFTGETPIHVAYQHVHGGMPTASSRVPSTPPALDDLIQAATARNPDDRPADAGEFLDLLRRTRATLTTTQLDARPDTAGARSAAAIDTAAAVLPGAAAAAATRDLSALGSPASTVSQRSDTARLPVALTPSAVLPASTAPVRRRRTWWPAVLASALIAAATAWFFLLGPGASTTVPAVKGKTESAAIQSLTAAKLDPTVTQAFDEKVPKGTVVSVDPTAGTTVRVHTDVTVTVSKGPERFTVPTLAGRTQAEAEAELASSSLTVGKVTAAYSEKVAEGQVISTNPKAGASVKRDTAVALTISKGREPITVPDHTGKDAEKAAKALADLGLKVEATAQENSDTVPKGAVITQTPASGTLFKGDLVTLVVSKGPALVDVPNVISKQVADAVAILEGQGFVVDVKRIAGGFFGTVRYQSPESGQAPKGSTVTITIV